MFLRASLTATEKAAADAMAANSKPVVYYDVDTDTWQIDTAGVVGGGGGGGPAAAGSLTGATLAANVTNSSLQTAAGGTFGTAAFTSSSAYATAAQGVLADAAAPQGATTTALAAKANSASPTFTGTVDMSGATAVAVPTIAGTSDSDQSAASTAFVQAVAALKAPLASPTFTGAVSMSGASSVSVPTIAGSTDSDTSAASTAFVQAVVAAATLGGFARQFGWLHTDFIQSVGIGPDISTTFINLLNATPADYNIEQGVTSASLSTGLITVSTTGTYRISYRMDLALYTTWTKCLCEAGIEISSSGDAEAGSLATVWTPTRTADNEVVQLKGEFPIALTAGATVKLLLRKTSGSTQKLYPKNVNLTVERVF